MHYSRWRLKHSCVSSRHPSNTSRLTSPDINPSWALSASSHVVFLWEGGGYPTLALALTKRREARIWPAVSTISHVSFWSNRSAGCEWGAAGGGCRGRASSLLPPPKSGFHPDFHFLNQRYISNFTLLYKGLHVGWWPSRFGIFFPSFMLFWISVFLRNRLHESSWLMAFDHTFFFFFTSFTPATCLAHAQMANG